jgi:polysaccharide biosynthesis protein PslG
MFALLALAAGCGHGSSATAPPADAGADDGGDSSFPEAPRAPSTLALADIVGLSTHIQLGGDAASVAERAFEWSKLAELGAHRLRADFTWATIEPSRGSFDFAQYDTLVSEAQAHGVSLLAILDYGVTWATSAPNANDDYPPDHAGDFASFAVAVANRYAGKVTEYEVWNEPNNGFRFWQPTLNGDPSAYGELLDVTIGAIRTVQAPPALAYAGTVYNDLVSGPSFVVQSFAKTPGLAASLGTLAMHAYEAYPPSRGPESAVGEEVPLVDKVATMSGVLAASGAKPVPVWITEIGWPVTMQVPPAAQARYTVRAIVLGALAGVDRLYLYTLLDGPNPSAFPPEDAFGLCTYSDFSADAGTPSEKPAFVGVKALLGAVGTYGVQKRLSATPSDVYLVQLSGPGGAHAWVAWRATDGASPTAVTVPATGNVAVTSIDGSVENDAAGASGYTLQVGPDPVVVAPR